jgi:biopolymer transport protein ExbD
MKMFKFVPLVLLFFSLTMSLFAQDNTVVLQRTPEQEAAKQTEKLQQELNLSTDQIKQVYEINLRYARERQISNTRSEAMERMKNKNNDIQRVLNPEQNSRLQTKRYERTTPETLRINGNQPSNPSGFRARSEYRQAQKVRVPSSDINLRSTYRSSLPVRNGMQVPQAVRRGTQNPTPSSVPRTVPTSRSTQAQPAARSGSTETDNSSTRTQNPSAAERR